MEALLEKIRKIEALIEGAKTEGEKNAAISAGAIGRRDHRRYHQQNP